MIHFHFDRGEEEEMDCFDVGLTMAKAKAARARVREWKMVPAGQPAKPSPEMRGETEKKRALTRLIHADVGWAGLG